MKNDEFITRYGEEAYAKRLEQRREWGAILPGGEAQRSRERRDAEPKKVIELGRQLSRKGGKYYERRQEYIRTGLQGKRNKIRGRHRGQWQPYKRIIAPGSQLHHQWRPQSDLYDGVALVEVDAHMHGFIDVIEILEGKITLLTEEEVRGGKL